MGQFNVFATLIAAVSVFALGGFWYSPKAFLNLWLRESKMEPIESHGPRPFIISFLFSLLSAALFSLYAAHGSLSEGLVSGLVIGIGWVFASFGINYQFGGKSMTLLLIDGGYHVAQFLLYGLIFGLWN